MEVRLPRGFGVKRWRDISARETSCKRRRGEDGMGFGGSGGRLIKLRPHQRRRSSKVRAFWTYAIAFCSSASSSASRPWKSAPGFSPAQNARDRRGAGSGIAGGVGLLRAVKVISRSQSNDGYGANSSPSRGRSRRRAFRPFATFPHGGALALAFMHAVAM
jgi:hypothetical protein